MSRPSLELTDHVWAESFNVGHDRDGTILTRGTTSIRVSGELAREVVERVRTARNRNVTVEDILAGFDEAERSEVKDFLEHLLLKRILVRRDDEAGSGVEDRTESAAAVFYWDFGLSERDVLARIRDVRIDVVGLNLLSGSIVSQLRRCGFENVPSLAIGAGDLPEQSLGGANPDLVVAAADVDGQASLLPWNKYCLERGIEFLPVLVESTRGTIGPWTISRQTACLNCLRTRQNANLEYYESTRAAQSVPYAGAHPALAEIVGSLAGWEIARRFTGIPGWRAGVCFTFRMLDFRWTSHRVLRVARCTHCSPRNSQSPVNIEGYEFTTGE